MKIKRIIKINQSQPVIIDGTVYPPKTFVDKSLAMANNVSYNIGINKG